MKQIIAIFLQQKRAPAPSVKQAESLKIVSVKYKPPGYKSPRYKPQI